MNHPAFTIRPSEEKDIVQIQSIYAHHVLTGTASFEITPPDVSEMLARRAAIVAKGLPYLVAVRGDEVLGYAYATVYRPRPAYRFTVEDSVYIREGIHGKGIGKALLQAVIDHCTACG